MIVKTDRTARSDGEYLASIIDSSPVALISLDTGLRIFMFNRAACALTIAVYSFSILEIFKVSE